MGINLRPDVSYLFSSINNKSSSNFLDFGFLSDYASIKSGSYSKLVKAYYSKLENDNASHKADKEEKSDKLSTSLAQDSSKRLANIKSSADSLKDSAIELMETGKESLFVEKDIVTKNEDGTETITKGYDVKAVYKAVSDFVDNYNEVIDGVNESDSSTVQNAAKNMTNITNLYTNTLKDIGITIGKDNKLTVDEKVFKAADTEKIKEAFNGSHSFASSVSSQASFVNSAATREASKANTYTGSGTYSNNFSTGDIFSSLF